MDSFVRNITSTEHFPCQTFLSRFLKEYNLSATGKGYSGESENNRNQRIRKQQSTNQQKKAQTPNKKNTNKPHIHTPATKKPPNLPSLLKNNNKIIQVNDKAEN